MGFESFQVELCGGQVSHAQANEAVAKLPHARPDPDALSTPGATYYTLEDGSHVIEVEVSPLPTRVSCRFTLCHPPSVEAALLGALRELMGGLGMEARICDEVLPEDAGWFKAARFADLSAAIARCAALRRAEWVAAFGPEQLAATTPEVYRRLILPRCVQVTGSPQPAPGHGG